MIPVLVRSGTPDANTAAFRSIGFGGSGKSKPLGGVETPDASASEFSFLLPPSSSICFVGSPDTLRKDGVAECEDLFAECEERFSLQLAARASRV